jgi:hypothetical protein
LHTLQLLVKQQMEGMCSLLDSGRVSANVIPAQTTVQPAAQQQWEMHKQKYDSENSMFMLKKTNECGEVRAGIEPALNAFGYPHVFVLQQITKHSYLLFKCCAISSYTCTATED